MIILRSQKSKAIEIGQNWIPMSACRHRDPVLAYSQEAPLRLLTLGSFVSIIQNQRF